MSQREPLRIELDDPGWLRFLDARQDALPFHHPSWAAVLAEVYRYRAFALLFGDEAGLPLIEVRSPLGGRRWVSLPFTDHCPPLAEDSTGLAALLEEERRRASIRSVEVRGALTGARTGAAALAHRLELDSDPETVFARFHRGQVQRGIRKAEKNGLAVVAASEERDMTHVFYPLFVETRRRLGVPVQPRRFFERLWHRMIQPGLGSVLLVFHDSTPVAGGVFLTWNGTTVYKYGASNAATWALRPNHLLFWTAIREACARGDTVFDFGRTDFHSEGLRAFKSGWGTREEELVYSTLSARAPATSSGRIVRAAGAVIRRSPPWVSRAAGELLYKYAA